VKNKKQIIIHPIAFGVYPALALIAHNILEMSVLDGVRALIVSVFLSVVIFLFFRMLLKNWGKAGLISSFALILFFSYGHIYEIFRNANIFGIYLFRHRFLGSYAIVIFAVGIWLILRKLRNPQSLNATLNIIAVAALTFPLFNLVTNQLQVASSSTRRSPFETILPAQPGDSTLPDIYYIILDAYSRDDYLKKAFNYDNSAFLKSLKDRGFFIGSCSQSNYSQTRLSLASSLNMSYMDTLLTYPYKNSEADLKKLKGDLTSYIQENQVMNNLKQLGYKTIAFETGFHWTELKGADLLLRLDDQEEKLEIFSGLNDFEVLMIRSTGLLFLSAVSPTLSNFLLPDLGYPNQVHRERVLFVLESLEKMPKMPGPKYVFAHLVSPHQPFVLGPNGEILKNQPVYRYGYPDQITYLNKRIPALFDEILENSRIPPIIILQADHGASRFVDADGRMAILNAYYLPDGGNELLYENISPVNTFRIIFDYYYDQQYDLLQDNSYYSEYTDPLNFTEIQNTRKGCDN